MAGHREIGVLTAYEFTLNSSLLARFRYAPADAGSVISTFSITGGSVEGGGIGALYILAQSSSFAEIAKALGNWAY